MADSTTKDPLDVSPQPIPMPQQGALTPPVDPENEDGADSLAAPPDLGPIMAQHTIQAGQVNHGDSRDWAENTVAGVQAALAGFGAAGKVPAGAGALYGVGAAARQGAERRDQLARENAARQQRQQQIDLEKRRTDLEETNQNRDYQLKLAENARQQAQSVRDVSLHDARMRQLTDEHNEANQRTMHEDITFRQNQVEHEETIKSLGGAPMKIAGQETPAFDDLGQLEQYAVTNKLAEQAHATGYRERALLGADGKYRIYQVPDTGPEWHEVKDAEGKTTKVFGDPLAILNYQEKVAQVREANARTTLGYAEAKAKLEDLKDQGTVKAARKALDKVGGDYSKLEEGQKQALRRDTEREHLDAWNVVQAAQRDMQRDSDYFSVPTDQKGNPDTNSAEYKALAKKYHLDQANDDLDDVYDRLRQLGYGYKKPGGPGTNPQTQGPAAPTKGTPITPAAIEEFKKLSGGDPEKAKAMAIAAGWGPPAAAPSQAPNPVELGAAGYGEGAAKTIR